MAHGNKRAHTPESSLSLPPLKRTHLEEPPFFRGKLRSFDASLSDEIVLDIFSYLTFSELCTVQLVNSFWARLATDSQLWKRLFLSDHPSQRLRGARGFSSQFSLDHGRREIKPLPARLRIEGETIWRPWKWMYRVSRNWRQGRCSVDALHGGDVAMEDPPAAGTSVEASEETGKVPLGAPHLLLTGDLVISASRHLSVAPAVVIHSPQHPPHNLLPKQPHSGDLHSITCLTFDHSSPPLLKATQPHGDVNFRLVVFYSTGSFSIFSIPPNNPSRSIEIYHFKPRLSTTSLSGNNVIQLAVYQHPILVTLTTAFGLTLWSIPDLASSPESSPSRIPRQRTFQSFTMFPPSSLSLSATSGGAYNLIIAYCTSVYPSHFLPAVSELRIGSDLEILGDRKSAVLGAANSWMDDAERGEKEREWGHKLSLVTASETDGKFLVMAGGNALQVYRISYKPHLRVAFFRSLKWPSMGVSALKVADGRCVCVSKDGYLHVWDLEEGWGVQVDAMESTAGAGFGAVGAVVFDEKRAVSLNKASGLQSWRFDV